MGNHIPMRECICCRKKSEKQALVRIVKNEQGFFVDALQKMQGRGAYLCKACMKDPLMQKKRPLDRAFRQKVEDSVYEEILKNS